jgi:hypothetical protein
MNKVSQTPKNGVGQNLAKMAVLSHVCPMLFGVGQNTSNHLKIHAKKPVPLWDKKMGQIAAD